MPRFQVILSAAESERFEAYCGKTGHKKSTLAARLIREHLDGERFAHQPELLPPSPATGARGHGRARP